MTERNRQILLYAGLAAGTVVILSVLVFGTSEIGAAIAAAVAAIFGGWSATRRDKKREADLDTIEDAHDAVVEGRADLVELAQDTAVEREVAADEIEGMSPEDKAKLGDDLLG
jgi:hypothetical protein